MTDTHTHLYLPEFENGGAEAVERAIAAGVGMMIFPNVDRSTIDPMLRLHESYPANTRFAIGLHPTEVAPDYMDIISGMWSYLDHPGCVAVGEIGIDLYWERKHRDIQMKAFEIQLRKAAERDIPAIVHCRDGLDETLEVLATLGDEMPEVVFHSFTGTPDDVARIRKVCDPMFGINGISTFKNAAEVRESIPVIGIDKLMLETDSPYLAPVPKRGKRNESSYIPYITAVVADTLGLTAAETVEATDFNARRFFRIKQT